MTTYTGQDYHAPYARHKAAESAGHCAECGWNDGDGVRTCFYAYELGPVSHQNSATAIRGLMSESQRSLIDSYDSGALVPWDAESEMLRLREIAAKRHDGDAYIAAGLARVETSLSGKPYPHRYAVDYPADYIRKPWWEPARLHHPDFFPPRIVHAGELMPDRDYAADEAWVSFMAHVYAPHSCGRGHGTHAGPYHIKCSGCGEEVKLWEFGIDYDIG